MGLVVLNRPETVDLFLVTPHYMVYSGYTLWLFNIAMENGPFRDDFPIKTSVYEGFSMAMLNNQIVL